jgi:hypothetical protein
MRLSQMHYVAVVRLGSSKIAPFHEFDELGRRRLCVDRFPGSITRSRILTNLEGVIATINQQSIAGQIWIDGSFLTEKLNPDDVDIALVITADVLKRLSSQQRQFFEGWISPPGLLH